MNSKNQENTYNKKHTLLILNCILLFPNPTCPQKFSYYSFAETKLCRSLNHSRIAYPKTENFSPESNLAKTAQPCR